MALFKKEGTLSFILGSFRKENNIFIAFCEEQFRKVDAHFPGLMLVMLHSC